MKNINFIISAVLLAGSLGLISTTVGAQSMVSKKVVALDGHYCHLKFPAIREDTLSWDRPVLEDASTSTLIDFYGPCDHSPLGKDEIDEQRRAESRTRWADGDDD
jgi:hypothetical protein